MLLKYLLGEIVTIIFYQTRAPIPKILVGDVWPSESRIDSRIDNGYRTICFHNRALLLLLIPPPPVSVI